MCKGEVPKLKKENFSLSKREMNLYLSRIGDNSIYQLDNRYTVSNHPMNFEQLIKKKDHNSLMIKITYALNDLQFDDVKNCINAKQMWEKIEHVHYEDPNIFRDQKKNLRGKYDDMRMKECESDTHYVNQIKVVSVIRSMLGLNLKHK